MRKFVVLMGNFAVWLAGGQPELLARFPRERTKHVVIGSMVAVTAVMAATSASFALRIALRVPLPVAIIAALGWGCCILLLDRMLVVSLTRLKHWWSYVLLAISRLALAALVGFIISTPFTLRIFSSEIAQQVAVIHQQDWQSYLNTQSTGPDAKTIAGLQHDIDLDNDTIATGVPPGVSATAQSPLPGLQGQLATLQQAAATALSEYRCALYGGPGCPPAGQGPVESTAYQQYLQVEKQISTVEGQITAEETAERTGRATTIKDAQQQLATDKTALANAQQAQTAVTAQAKRVEYANDGLLIQLAALDQLTARGGITALTHWLVFALFMLFECLPVLVKLLLSAGRESWYEKAVDDDEKQRYDDVKNWRQLNQTLEDMAKPEEKDAWRKLLPDLAREAAQVRRASYLAALRRSLFDRSASLGQGQQPSMPPVPPLTVWPTAPDTRVVRHPTPSKRRPARTVGMMWRRHRTRSQPAPPGYGLPGLPGTYTAEPPDLWVVSRQPPVPGAPPALGSQLANGYQPGTEAGGK